tara:strand:- start:68 stop:307 length:240 start_codon:yes stop_codon:yes gene_type:complete
MGITKHTRKGENMAANTSANTFKTQHAEASRLLLEAEEQLQWAYDDMAGERAIAEKLSEVKKQQSAVKFWQNWLDKFGS